MLQNKIYKQIIIFTVLNYSIMANAVDTFGFSPKGVALTGALTSSVNDWSAPFYNMAGLTAPLAHSLDYDEDIKSVESTADIVKDPSIDANVTPVPIPKKREPILHIGTGYLHQIPLVNITPQLSNSDVTKQIEAAKAGLNYGFIQVGIVANLNNLIKMPFGIPIALGLGLQLPSDLRVATVVDLNPPQYNFIRLGYNTKRLFLSSGLSIQVWKDKLSIGGGVNLFIRGEGAFKVSAVNITTDRQLPKNELKLDFGPVVAPNAGIMFRQKYLQHNFLFGASYQGELVFKVTPLTALAETAALNITLDLELVVLYYYTPHIINGGFSYVLGDIFKLHLDADYQLWSKYTFNPATISAYPNQLPKYKDTVSGKLGLEYRIGRHLPFKPGFLSSIRSIWIRGGYRFLQGILPNTQTGITNYLDSDKHIFGFGLSYTLPKNIILQVPTEISIGGQYQYWASNTQIKNYASIDAALAVANPSYQYSAHVFVISVSASWKF